MIVAQKLLWWRHLDHEMQVREEAAQQTLGEATELATKLRKHRDENHFGWSIHQALRPSPLKEHHP